jgi:hypothetical protein
MLPQYTSAWIDRFWSKVDKSGECWLWTKAHMKNGYGETFANGHVLYTHRVAYELTYGSVPDGLFVCHRCDNPGCVRPDHLFAGTHTDNMRDMIAKGRGMKDEQHARGDRNGRRLHPERYGPPVMPPPRRGETNHKAKLTEDDVREIRRRHALGDTSYKKLGAIYGVSDVNIMYIVRRMHWTHVP